MCLGMELRIAGKMGGGCNQPVWSWVRSQLSTASMLCFFGLYGFIDSMFVKATDIQHT